MNHELKDSNGRVYLTISVDNTNQLIYVEWSGYLSEEFVTTGAMAYLKIMEENNYHSVINDNTMVIGTWDHSMNWVLTNWATQAAKSGLTHLAMLFRDHTSAESSALTLYNKVSAFQVKVFNDKDQAINWIKQYSLKAS